VSEKSYFRLMIFTIMSAIVSIILLVLLLLGFLQEYIYFVLGVECGIVIIIIYCIYKITRASSKWNLSIPTIYFNSCPDFYTQKTDSNGVAYCANEHIVKDTYNNQSILKTYPLYTTSTSGMPVTLPQTNDDSPPMTATPRYDRFYLNELEYAKDLPETSDKCQPLFGYSSNYAGYDVIPWSRYRSECQSFLT